MLQLNKDFGNKKLQQIVEKGMELFWHYGYKRISIEEICKEAGVSKNTFYKHFPNKLALIKLILNELYRQGMKDYEEIMELDISFENKIQKILKRKLKASEDMSANFFKDLYVTGNKDILDIFHNLAGKREEIILRTFQEAQQKGDINKEVKLEFIMYFLNQMEAMIKDEVLLKMFKSPTDLIMEITNFFYYGIMPHNRSVTENE